MFVEHCYATRLGGSCMEWIVFLAVLVTVVGGVILARVVAARRLGKHLDAMQAAEAAKVEVRRRERQACRS